MPENLKTEEKMNDTFVRSATFERGHIFMPGYNVIMVARIKGQFSETALRTAIQKIRQRHPLLGVHIEFDENHQAWFTSRNTLDIPLKVYPRTSDKAWLEACSEENKIPFRLDTGPLLRVIWVKDTSVSELILLGQHAICDGASLVFLMRDLLMYLGDPTMEVEVLDDLPTLDKAANLDQIKLNLILRKVIAQLTEIWKSNEIRFVLEDFEPLQTVFNEGNFQILTYELSPEETEELIQKSREHKVTVNSVLYSALLSAQLEIEGTEKNYLQNILLPINLRPYLNLRPDIVGFYAGGESFPHKVTLKKNFWRRTRDLHVYLQKHITMDAMLSNAKRLFSLPPTWIEARSILFLGNKLPESNPKYDKLLEVVKKSSLLQRIVKSNLMEEFQIGLALTNLGNMEIPLQYGELELETIFFVPPTNLLAEKVIGILTVGGKLRIVISYLEKYLKTEIAQSLLNRALEIIKEN
ncbi:MAG: condensation domain-containing protein [Candidatus Hermodarchaeota archaeon]